MAGTTLDTSLIIRLIDRVTGPIKRIIAGVRDIEKANKRVRDNFKLAADMKLAGDAVSGFAAQAASVLEKPVRTFTDFEEQMSKVRALTFKGEASEENKRLFDELSAKARKLGADTQFSGSEAAQGMTLLATAGFSAREQIDAMGGVLDIAAASGSGLAASSEISAQTLRGFRLEAKEMSRVGDVLVNTFSSSQTTLESLGETMKYVAPVAASAGVSLEKTAAMAGVLGDVGIQASQAGTTLRAVISRLSAPTGRRAKSALQFLGINPKDKAGNLRPIEDLLAEMQAAMDRKFGVGKGGARRASLVKAIFGEEPQAGVEALLLAAGSGKLQQAIDANTKAAGTAHKIAVDMAKNTAGAAKELDSALEEFQLTVGEMLIPTVVDLLTWGRETVLWITDLAKEWPNATKYAVMFIGAVAGLTFVVGAGIKIAATAVTIWAGLTKAYLALAGVAPAVVGAFTAIKAAALANPITAIVMGVATAALLIYKYWDPISEFFGKLWDSVTAAFRVAMDWIIKKIEWALDKVGYIKDALTGRDYGAEIAAGEEQAASLRKSSSLFADDDEDYSVHGRVFSAPAPSGPTIADRLMDSLSGGLSALEAQGAPIFGDGAGLANYAPDPVSGELKITVDPVSAQVVKTEAKARGPLKIHVDNGAY